MIRAAALVMATLCITAATAAGSDTRILGDWARRDGETRIRIEPCGSAICAVNTWVRDPAGSEKVGDVLKMTLKPATPTELSGSAYDERRRMTYTMHLTVGPDGLQTQGCVLLGVLCKSAEWTRIQ